MNNTPDAVATQSSAPRNRVEKIALALVMLLATVIQFTVVNGTSASDPFRADAGEYYSYAHNLKYLDTYSRSPTFEVPIAARTAPVPDTLRTPGYPLFLYPFLDPMPTYAALDAITRAQAMLGVLSVFLAYLISRRFLGEGGAIAVAALSALSPHLATISTYVLSESLFTFLLLASVYAACRAFESGNYRWFAAAGLVLGLSALTRPTLQFLPFLALAPALLWRPWRGRLKGLGLSLAIMLAVMSPWLVYSLQTPHRDGEPNLTINFLHHGSYPGFMYKDNPFTLNAAYRHDPDSPRIARNMSSVLRHIAGKFRDEPGKYLHWYLLGKPGYFLSWTITDGYADIYLHHVKRSPFFDQPAFIGMRDLMFWLHWPLMLSGIAGALLVLLKPSWLGLQPSTLAAARVLVAVLAYTLAFHMIGAPYPRYGIPFRPLIYALAVLFLMAAWQRTSSPDAEKSPSATAD